MTRYKKCNPPLKANPRFCQYKRKPVMVLEANNDNNLLLKKI